ncbi:MAG: lasso peptide biosynthesis B2 protein, partial [Armatimonadota bacterium]|nr:lasso peptide biosynthesis B2 protein [Armatimonadota bacterium]
LSWRERWVLIEAWWLLFVVELALRTLPYGWVDRAFSCRSAHVSPGEGAEVRAAVESLLRLVRQAARHHPCRPLCLRQALVARFLLGRRGIPVTVRMGVRKESGTLAAHAWVEYEGHPVGEPQETYQRFTPLPL